MPSEFVRGERPRDITALGIQCLHDIAASLTRPKVQIHESHCPPDLETIELRMSNLDHSIDDGLEAALRNGRHRAVHAAWNFHGTVWFADGRFHEEVWVYGDPKAVIGAPTLAELMDAVNERFGSD